MTDKELLELAAKAAGFIYKTVDNVLYIQRKRNPKDDWYGWNPITDDGDALRLAVKLNIDLNHSWVVVNGDDNYPMASIHASCNGQNFFYELKESDPHAATRRAIVMVAAELAKTEEFA